MQCWHYIINSTKAMTALHRPPEGRKKMTVEIKNIGKITASKEVLNMISLWASQAAERNTLKGYEGLADEADKAASTIYKALKAAGLYENL